MMLLTARKRAFGPEQLAAGQVCRLSDLRRHAQPATLVDFRGSSLSDAGSIPAISTLNALKHGRVLVLSARLFYFFYILLTFFLHPCSILTQTEILRALYVR